MAGGALAQTPLAQSPLVAPRERLWPFFVVAFVLHVAFFGFALYYPRTARLSPDQKPIVAKLVRLGEKKPEQFLPRKEPDPPPAPGPVAATPPAAPPEPVKPPPEPPKPAPPKPEPAPPKMVAPAPAVKPPPPKEPKPAPPKALAKGPTSGQGGSEALASVLSRMRREQALSGPVYGDPEGDPMGDSSEGSAGDLYLAMVVRALRDSYVLPSTLSEADRVSLEATVVLYLDERGDVVRSAFEKRSGNGAFDSALERAIRAARIPPPPPELRQKYRTEGLGVRYRP